jgi:GNAT superfamily N-acetyltransferase
MFRLATEEDRNYITKTLTCVWTTSRKNDLRSKKQLEARINEFFNGTDKRGPATIIVHCNDDDNKYIRGFMIYSLPAPKKAVVHAIFTRPQFRRQGIATLFLSRLLRAGVDSVCFTLDLVDDGVFMPVVASMFDNVVSIRHTWANDRFTKEG